MARKTALSILFLSFILSCYSQSDLKKYFREGSLRYDIDFVGNADTFWVIHDQTKVLKSFVGNQVTSYDERDLGEFRFIIYDITSGERIFQKGFNPIFQEWLLTPEAKLRNRTFYQALYFPMPVNDVRVSVEIRDKKNVWEWIFSDTIHHTDCTIKNDNPTFYPIDTIRFSGDASEKIDVAILSEGYTARELEKFSGDAHRMVDTLLSSLPFNFFPDRFNFFSVKVPSEESGSDMPDEKIFKNTAFNTTFNTFDSPRYLTTFDLKSVYDAVDGIPWDYLIILVNSKRYGGGGFYNFLSISSSDNTRSPHVFIHEFGHSFAGLGDEYFNTEDLLQANYTKGVEPWEPNLTTLVNFHSKWENMVDPTTPLPTPRDSVYSSKVGAFEGGGYLSKGIYSPAMNCWMKELSSGGFCPVCQEAIRKTILNQSK